VPAPEPHHPWHPGLLSDRVTGSQYFVLELAAARRGWRLALGGRERCQSDYVVERQRYAYHVLEYVAEGRGRVVMDGRPSPLGPGTVLAYAPDTRLELRTDPAAPMLKYFFCLAGPGAGARLRAAGVAPGTVRAVPAHAEIRSVAEDLVRDGQRTGGATDRICGLQLELLLVRVADLVAWPRGGPRPAQEAFLRAKAVLDTRLDRPLTLGEAARLAGMDVSSMCRLFRRFQGTSPYQYLLRRKMNLAAEHLLETGGQVKAAAVRVGFTDPYHFSRCFKAVHGVPPSRLRGRGAD